jgi:hypothetical protein
MTTKTSHKQGIRLFFSADLTGSTAYKGKDQNFLEKDGSIYEPKWPIVFRQFFSEIADGFTSKARDNSEKSFRNNYGCMPFLWRILGDEILFYSSTLRTYADAVLLINAFISIIEKYDLRYKEEGLGVKGTIWSAGFPIRNKLIRVDTQVAPYFWIDDLNFKIDNINSSHDGYAVWSSERIATDFLGPEIDLGFRLTKLTLPGRVIISLDAAIFIAKASLVDGVNVRLFHVGWQRLKGVFGDVPYPVIWCDSFKENEKTRSRTSYEEAESDFSEKYLDASLKYRISKENLLILNNEHYKDTKAFRLKEPYLDPNSDVGTMPLDHRNIWNTKNHKE